MRLACMQFAPQLGRVEENIERADALIQESRDKLTDVDFLVLPELAFTGKETLSW